MACLRLGGRVPSFSRLLLRPSSVLRVTHGHWRQPSLACRALPLSSSALRAKEPSRGVPYTSSIAEATLEGHVKSSPLPAYRILDSQGKVLDPDQDPMLSDSMLLEMYEKMILQRVMDEQLYKAQRMGLTSFYMMNTGEEGIQYGSSAAFDPRDTLYLQYREVGVVMWRGFTLDQCMDQCFSNRLDTGKGRQMPVHYGSPEHNIQFISSCLATQMPHAPGYAYGLKLAGEKLCVGVYFGDGAAQEGDSHAAMNFAATLGCPVVFMCRNNGYAISTPAHENYHGDGIAARGPGYGIETLRVDGNDLLAVYTVTKYAREVAVQEHRPVLVEAFTYRIGSHSTSDDQTGYQDMQEVAHWKEFNDPVDRLQRYMENRGIWTETLRAELQDKSLTAVKQSMQRARRELKPRLDELFNDVYDQLPPRLQRQRRQMWEVVNKHKEHYPLSSYEA